MTKTLLNEALRVVNEKKEQGTPRTRDDIENVVKVRIIGQLALYLSDAELIASSGVGEDRDGIEIAQVGRGRPGRSQSPQKTGPHTRSSTLLVEATKYPLRPDKGGGWLGRPASSSEINGVIRFFARKLGMAAPDVKDLGVSSLT